LDTLELDRTLRTTRASVRQSAQAVWQGQTPVRGNMDRHIHTAQQGMELPGRRVRTEGQDASGDIAADEAYEYLGATYSLFWNVYGRNSIDEEVVPLIGTVHSGEHYENAFWNGWQMVFGDGDGRIFNRFTVA